MSISEVGPCKLSSDTGAFHVLSAKLLLMYALRFMAAFCSVEKMHRLFDSYTYAPSLHNKEKS